MTNAAHCKCLVGDVFRAYDEQPGPSVDDYFIDPDYPEEAYF